MPKNKLIIFVKNEETGKVKTRLARSVGDEKALEVYHRLLAYTAHEVKGLEVEKEVWYSRFIPEADIWDEEEVKKRIQSGKDLGGRMRDAFETSLKKEGCDKVIIIGSDCPDLTTAILEEAFQKLDNSDAVLGPARDGGYYLIGMNRFLPEAFHGIEWSTTSVFRKTVKNLSQAGAGFSTLPILNDVDTIEDWEKVKEKLGNLTT